VRCGYGMAGGSLTDVTLHTSRNYHQVRATEIRRLSKDVAVACGAVVVICGSCEMEERKQYVVVVKSVVMWAGVRE